VEYNKCTVDDATQYVLARSARARFFHRQSMRMVDQTIKNMVVTQDVFCDRDDLWADELKRLIKEQYTGSSIIIQIIVGMLVDIIIDLIIAWWRNRQYD
jgi:hypothetical protein